MTNGAKEALVENLFAMMRTFALCRAEADVWEEAGLLCVYSGLPGAVFNSVLLTEAIQDEEELRLKLEYADALYKRRRARWSLWLIEHYVPPKLLGRIGPMVDRYGLTSVLRGQGMIAESLNPPLRRLPELEILPVYAPATRFDFCHVMSVAFRTPLKTFVDVYNTPAYWEGPLRGFVAYSGNRAVGTACIMPAAGVLGVYGVAVLPDVQRKGIGECILRHGLETLSRETGLNVTVLESSEIALGLYRRMGYAPVAALTIYNESH